MRFTFNRTIASFWTLGAMNNIPYVIMLSAAKSISEGGTGIVFLANIMPGLLVKLSAPYWFDRVGYRKRMKMASVLMMSSFLLVACFSQNKNAVAYEKTGDDSSKSGSMVTLVIMQLFGVALCSMQGSLGEASLLALCGKVDSIMNQTQRDIDGSTATYDDVIEDSIDNQIQNDKKDKSLCITAFSSGTGLAGVLGFAFNYLCTQVLGMSLSGMLVTAMIIPIIYWHVFNTSTERYISEEEMDIIEDNEIDETVALSSRSTQENSTTLEQNNLSTNNRNDQFWDNPDSHGALSISASSSSCVIDNRDDDSQTNVSGTIITSPSITNINKLNTVERFRLSLTLWPYMIPLFVVYAAEYALQSGVWTAIGFPVDDQGARNSFYIASSWTYQVGVFVSRSSGAFFTAPMWVLWLMPLIQTLNLIFFSVVATFHFWYDYSLLFICFYVGLLGGSVYVHGYTRINHDLPPHMREFALSTTSVADNLGIVLADVSGLFIQSCLYMANGLDGTLVTCPLTR